MSVKLKQNLKPDQTEYNILILGETGAGKSTTINALANYLKFSSFGSACEASLRDFITPIPAQFALSDPETDDATLIRLGSDENENPSDDGNSCTQSPMGHVFTSGNKSIRIIDTPGMGDTSGISTDKENFEKILCFLKHHRELHGICVLIKANENRKTALFRYCITELLTHLHKSACRNMFFMFTYSRNTFYEPGDGFMTLKRFLQNELKSVQLELKKSLNCFFIDNEAYRFLVASKQGYKFPENQIKLYKESWEKSAQQIQRMMENIFKLEPHQLDQTAGLNNARKLLIKMAEPLVQLQANINENIERIRLEEAKLKASSSAQKQTKQTEFREITLEVMDLEMKALEYPTTVCTAQKCVEVLDTHGQHKVNYKTRCHEDCSLVGVEVNLIGDSLLKNCWAFSCGASELCDQNCGCPWQKHMHVTCEYVKTKRNIVIQEEINDPNSKNDSSNSNSNNKQLEAALRAIQKLVDEYKKEFDTLQEISSKFAYILSVHSNTPFNRYIEPYLDLLIEEEQNKINSVLNYPRAALTSLLDMKKKHQEMVNFLVEAMKGTNKQNQNVSIDDVAKYRDQLCKLKHTGPQFKQMIETQIESRQQEFEYKEKFAMELRA